MPNGRDKSLALLVERIDRCLQLSKVACSFSVEKHVKAGWQERLTRARDFVTHGAQGPKRRGSFGIVLPGKGTFDLLDAPIESLRFFTLLREEVFRNDRVATIKIPPPGQAT